MVDTGSDITVLAPRDAARAGIDLSAVRDWQPAMLTSTGIPLGFVEPAFARFSAGNRAYEYGIGLLVAAPNRQTVQLQSLLGRDILHHWDINYNFSRRRLSFTIVDADASVRIN